MYEAFDKFLAVETWYTAHPLDEKRFFKALQPVVRSAEFSPEAMGDYMRQKTQPPNNQENPYDDAIGHYVSAAWAVKEYLEATGE